MVAMLPDVEIHIIPGIPEKAYNRQKNRWSAGSLYFSWMDLVKTLSVLFVTTLVGMALRAVDIGEHTQIMLYILSVLIVSRVTTGYLYGVAASVLSVLLYNFFFTSPYYTFTAIERGYPVTFIIMFIAAVITSALTVRIKTQARLSIEREHRTKLLYEINKKLLVTRGLENIVGLTNEYITKIFDRGVAFYTEDPEQRDAGTFAESASDKELQVLKKEEERAVAHWVFMNKKKAGAGTDTLMGAKGHYIPIISQGNVLGVLGISYRNGPLDGNNLLFLRMLASQVAMALERQRLSDEQRTIIIASEKEKMRSNLLRAISHDLRTPLTGILGSSSVLLESGNQIDRVTHDRLISNIKEDSQWLIRMVENLLSVTRIHEEKAYVAKSEEAAEEIVAEAIGHIRKRFPDRKITVKAPDDLLMVPMDGTLIQQVLINLVENAVKHSSKDSMLGVTVKKEGDWAIFEVADQGDGIPEEDLPYLFESYIPDGGRSADSARGMGIGLSICMSIIKAHHGQLEAENKKDGGAVFRFKLPLEEKSS